METDREFVRLLTKWLSHRVYLNDKEGKSFSPYLPPAGLGSSSFPQKLEDADASYLQIYYAPKDLAAPQTIMYDETRASLQEYRILLDEAAPMEILEIPEFIRVVQPDNRPTYSEIWKTVRSYNIDQIKSYLFLAQNVFREMPTFQSAYENNQDNLVSLTDSIKKYQKESLLKNADREVVIQFIENRLRQVLLKKIEEYRGRRTQLGKSRLEEELVSDLTALQRALELNGFVRSDYRKITRPLDALFDEEIAKQRKRIRKRVREIVKEQERAGMLQREAVFDAITQRMRNEFARELSNYEGRGQLSKELSIRISYLQNVMESEFRRQLRNVENLSYKERRAVIKEEVVDIIEQDLLRYLDIQTWRQEGAKAARAEEEKRERKSAPFSEKVKSLNPFAKKTAQQEIVERFLEKFDEVERAAGTAKERELAIDFFRGQLLNLFKQDALSTVREFRDLDDKELRELISVRYINDELRSDLVKIDQPLSEAGEDFEVITEELLQSLTQQLVDGIMAARNLRNQSDGDLTKEFKILLLSKMTSLEGLEGYEVNYNSVLRSEYENNPNDLSLLRSELKGYLDFSQFDSYQINFEALRRFAFEGDLALQLGVYFKRQTDKKSSSMQSKERDEMRQKRDTSYSEFQRRKATEWLMRESVLSELGPSDRRFIERIRSRIPSFELERMVSEEYHIAERAFQEAVSQKDPIKLEVEALALFRQALDDQPRSSFQYHARFRIGDIKVEQAYLLLEQGRVFAKQGMKEMADRRKKSAQQKLSEARDVYQNEALFNPAPIGFPRTEFTRFWLAQLLYDQGNVKAAQVELDLFLSEFSNNRGDLKLGDNALFIQGVCQSDQGDYDIAKETFYQVFTLKSTGRLMADMARLQRSSLTSPIDQGNGNLIESEYSAEFSNIKRDLHPHYFLSYKVMGDIELEDQRYDNAIERYRDAVSLFERSFQRRTYGDAENHYVSYADTQRQYNESLIGLSLAYIARYRESGVDAVTDLNLCIETVYKLLGEPELSPRVIRKAHLVLGDAHYIRANYYITDQRLQNQSVADFEEVIRTYRIIETEYPKLDIARTNNLAQTYLALNMPYESIKILEKQKADILISQISRPGLHQYELDLTNRMLGSIHRSLKNYTEAIASYQSIQIPEFKSELQSSIKNLQKLEALGN